jgi:hypothetical protein
MASSSIPPIMPRNRGAGRGDQEVDPVFPEQACLANWKLFDPSALYQIAILCMFFKVLNSKLADWNDG